MSLDGGRTILSSTMTDRSSPVPTDPLSGPPSGSVASAAGDASRPHVVILGGGFAGLAAARGLARKKVDVTLVDRSNHHTFQPLLYQVATTVLSPGQIAAPLRWTLRRADNVRVLLDEALDVDLERRRVRLAGGDEHPEGVTVGYDYLVVATGARHAYFGHPEWEEAAPGLKTVEDALDIRRRVLLAFELAERRASQGGPAEAPTFAVVGAGPTGVELAGALADIAREVLAGEFRTIDPRQARVVLLEGASRVLPPYPESLSASAERQLERLGVEVRTDSMVTAIEPGRLRIGDDDWLEAAVILWASGVQASPLGARLAESAGLETDRAGRVEVGPDLTLPGHRNVFVLGDLAVAHDEDGDELPGVAAVAMQQGKAVAESIRRDLAGREREPFRYNDRGSMATIGKKAAVADLGRLKLSGLLAWLAWLLVHLLFLVGFHNRMMVLREWVWAYFTSNRSARLITGSRRLRGWPPGERADGETDDGASSG